jgi:hypothetical protein
MWGHIWHIFEFILIARSNLNEIPARHPAGDLIGEVSGSEEALRRCSRRMATKKQSIVEMKLLPNFSCGPVG